MKPNQFDNIEAYLDNALSAEEKTAFEQALANDQELAKELAVYQLEREGQELLLEADLREKLLQWTSIDEEGDPQPAAPESNKTEARKNRRNWRFLLLLGSFVFLIVLVYVYWSDNKSDTRQISPPNTPAPSQQNEKNSPASEKNIPIADNKQPGGTPSKLPPAEKPSLNTDQQIALAYYENSDLADLVRGNGASGTNATLLQTAKEDFRNKKYQEVISSLQAIPTSDPYYWQVQELMGHALFKMKRFNESATIFNKIFNNNNNERGENAQWYLALSLLAQGKTNETIKLLQYLIDHAEPALQEQAKALLAELKPQ